MKAFIVSSVLFVGLALFSSCNNEPKERPKTPEELRAELKKQEQSEPLFYLSIDKPTMKHNMTRAEGLFRDAEYDGWLIEGKIKNTATLAKFKDVVLRVKHFSQTNTLIEQKDFVIYEFYEPRKMKNFVLKVYPPEAHHTFDVDVVRATPVD